ncbi:MAG: glycosyltransferase [Akkermansiaceae bacterium]|nr:glycosyltransferase [Akkermansiaceae bacterium]NNM29424.1 glycosyltransferase [Akkermansiaceae bacterium]
MATHGSGLELALLVPSGAKGLDRVDPQVQVLKYGAGGGRLNPFLWREVAKLIRSFRPDLVHTHFAKATAIYRQVHRWTRIPYVATKHNPRRGAAYRKVPHVIAVSEAVRDSIPHNRVRVIYNGLVPDETVTPVRRTGPRPLQILNVGRLEPVKGQDRLIEALAACGADWHLTILGEGPYRANLEKLAAGLGVGERVALPGYRADAPAAMAACDVFIQASHSEGFGVALLEAMHYAPLAVSTPVGLAAEVFPDWLCWDPGDANSLGEILKEADSLAERFEVWAREIRPRFHLDSCVREHTGFYREIAVPPRRPDGDGGS